MFFDVREGESVSTDPDRQYFVFSSETGEWTALDQRATSWAYWSPSYQSVNDLLDAWPIQAFNFIAYDGVNFENAGITSAAPRNGFSLQTPSIYNPEGLMSVVPGEPLEISVPSWQSPFATTNSTWLDIMDWSTRTSVWSSSHGSDDGMARAFDTTVLQPGHEYRLQVIYSARFHSSTESDLLGQTSVITGFDNRTVYHFTTASLPVCPADLTGDGKLDFFDVSAFIVLFQIGNTSADFNDDGNFDFFDVSAIIRAFTNGCPEFND